MISKLKQKGLQAKRGDAKINKASTRQWPGLRGNPRIVRVSPLFGGKDRHSKVCTIKGLRDRRTRLSAPTAIQLYELQNKLGLGQPSKVIDWLIEVTKLDIDKLPPLQIPEDFNLFYQQFPITQDPHASSLLPQVFEAPKFSTFIKDVESNQPFMGKFRYHWDADVSMEAENEETERNSLAEGKWLESFAELKRCDGVGNYRERIMAQKLSPLPNHAPLPGLRNDAMHENCYHFNPSGESLSSQFGTMDRYFQYSR